MPLRIVLLCIFLFTFSMPSNASPQGQALLQAVKNGDDSKVEQLLYSGIALDIRDKWGKQPIIIAASRGDIAIVQLLLSRGADINAKDNWQRTSLIAAVQNNCTWLADILIHRGADVNLAANNGISALIAAAQRGNASAANMLITAGAKVNARDIMGWTALMWAAKRGDIYLVNFLIEAGADVNLVDRDGKTVLDQVKERSNVQEMIELLCSRGAVSGLSTVNVYNGGSIPSIYFNDKTYQPVIDGRVSKGKLDAPVTIVVFTDLQCPYCISGAKVADEIMERYEGQIRMVIKHLPLEIHAVAMPAALYFEAIAQQDVDKAWQFYSRILAEQHRLKEGERYLRQAAIELGIDLQALDEALSSRVLKARIEADIAEADSFGFDGVPVFIINGKLLDGAYPLNDFCRVVDEMLVLSN